MPKKGGNKTVRKLLVAIIPILILVGMLMPARAVADDTGYFHTHTCYIYLARWVWNATLHPPRWSVSNGSIMECSSALDLRGLTEMGTRGTTDGELGGWSFFFCSKPITQTGSYLLSTTGFNIDMPAAAFNLLQKNYGITINASTINGTIWDMFVNNADPTGVNRWMPLSPEADGTIEIVINGFSPVVFAKDKPRCFPGEDWVWKGQWVKRWDFNLHRFINHWEYFKLPDGKR